MTIQQDIESGADVNKANNAFRALSNQVARALIPNVSRGYGRARDPYVRGTYTFLDTIKDGLPFYEKLFRIESRYVWPSYIFRRVWMGCNENLSEDIREMIVNITKKSTRKEETEYKNVSAIGYLHKRPSRKLTFSGQRVELDSKQYGLLEMTSGKQFKQLKEELANNPAYIKAKPL